MASIQSHKRKCSSCSSFVPAVMNDPHSTCRSCRTNAGQLCSPENVCNTCEFWDSTEWDNVIEYYKKSDKKKSTSIPVATVVTDIPAPTLNTVTMVTTAIGVCVAPIDIPHGYPDIEFLQLFCVPIHFYPNIVNFCG